MRRSVLVLVLLATAAAVPALAQSVVSEAQREEARGVPDRWGVSLGSFWQSFDTRFRLDGTGGTAGTDLEIETDLGLPKSQTNFQLGGFYRFSDRHRLDMSYVGWSRKNSRTIDRQIHWDDIIYDVGATVTSDTSGEMLNVIYKYSFFNNGKVLFGVNGGLSAMWTDMKLSGEGTVVGGGTASGTLAESKSAILPIPVIGVHFEMTLTKKLFWKAEGNFFAANISGYKSNVNEVTTSIAYYFTRNFGAGAGFNSISYKVDHTGTHADFFARFGFSGEVAYLTLVF